MTLIGKCALLALGLNLAACQVAGPVAPPPKATSAAVPAAQSPWRGKWSGVWHDLCQTETPGGLDLTGFNGRSGNVGVSFICRGKPENIRRYGELRGDALIVNLRGVKEARFVFNTPDELTGVYSWAGGSRNGVFRREQ